MSVVAILALLAATPAPQEPAKPICQNADRQKVADQPNKPGIHRLDQEPPARQVLTVLRTVDGCSKPVVIREDIGAPKR